MIEKNKNWNLDKENYLKEKRAEWDEQQSDKKQLEVDAQQDKEEVDEDGEKRPAKEVPKVDDEQFDEERAIKLFLEENGEEPQIPKAVEDDIDLDYEDEE